MSRMIKLFVLLMLTYPAFAQTITIKSIEQVTQLEQGKFYHPVAGPKGQLLFTGAGYVGLYIMDSLGKISVLSEEAGSGYEPTFSADGNYVYFRPYKYEGMKKLSSLIKKSVIGNEEQTLVHNKRNFTSAKQLSDGSIVVSKNSEIHISDASQRVGNSKSLSPAVFIEKGLLALYINGQKKILKPLGDGFYLWPSLSPDGSKLLFTKAGNGTFISNLSGDILVELGYANAPQWSPDGQWIVFMKDIDDGHRLIESDIYIISSNGKNTNRITQTHDMVETYPVWSSKNEIVFGSEKGVIFKAVFELN